MITAKEARRLAIKHNKEMINVEVLAVLFKIRSEAILGKTKCSIYTKSSYRQNIIEVLENKGYELNEYNHNCFEVKW